MDVTKDSAYEFVRQLYAEIALLFPDQWIHVGGDEGTVLLLENVDCLSLRLVTCLRPY